MVVDESCGSVFERGAEREGKSVDLEALRTNDGTAARVVDEGRGEDEKGLKHARGGEEDKPKGRLAYEEAIRAAFIREYVRHGGTSESQGKATSRKE